MLLGFRDLSSLSAANRRRRRRDNDPLVVARSLPPAFRLNHFWQKGATPAFAVWCCFWVVFGSVPLSGGFADSLASKVSFCDLPSGVEKKSFRMHKHFSKLLCCYLLNGILFAPASISTKALRVSSSSARPPVHYLSGRLLQQELMNFTSSSFSLIFHLRFSEPKPDPQQLQTTSATCQVAMTSARSTAVISSKSFKKPCRWRGDVGKWVTWSKNATKKRRKPGGSYFRMVPSVWGKLSVWANKRLFLSPNATASSMSGHSAAAWLNWLLLKPKGVTSLGAWIIQAHQRYHRYLFHPDYHTPSRLLQQQPKGSLSTSAACRMSSSGSLSLTSLFFRISTFSFKKTAGGGRSLYNFTVICVFLLVFLLFCIWKNINPNFV